MSNWQLFFLILGLTVVSYLPRTLPMFYFAKRPIPTWFSDWMKYVPIALFAALSFKDIFIEKNHFSFVGNVRIVAMFLVIFVAYKTKSMAISVIVGLVSLLLLLGIF